MESRRLVDRLANARPRAPRHSTPLEVLVVDDDEATRLALSFALTDAGHKVSEAVDGEEAIALVSEKHFDVAMLDVRLPKVDGLAVFRRIRQRSPSTSVILMTAFATISDATASLREGAYDYVTKPFDAEEFTLRVIGHIAEHRALRHELEEARRVVASREAGSPIIGHTPAMKALVERINTLAQSDAPVLIHGETGAGKELVAHTLHARSARKNGPFVTLHCAAFPDPLVHAELFGHGRDAFPGALRERPGSFVAADGGSILLDEVTALPLSAQAKLLRVLEQGVVQPVGSRETTPVNVRVMVATQHDLKELVAKGEFREDLYFRINVLDLEIPPLRERRADMPLLLAHFLRRFYPGRVPPGIAPRAWSALMAYPFPGNVREFAHAIERAVALARGSEIDLQHLPADIAKFAPSESAGATEVSEEEPFLPLSAALKEFEKQHVLRALDRASDEREAAVLLGISARSLSERMKRYGLA